MKANELRLGNYVYDGEKELCKIWAVHKDRLTVEIPNDNTTFLGRYKIEYAKPIPLTEEWLLKFGFILNNDDYYESRDGILCYVEDGKVNMILFEIGDWETEIDHVHQLQNLYFALTGEELKIEE